MPPVGVMAVDHRELARRAAQELVASTPGFTWLGDAASAEEALETVVVVLAADAGLALDTLTPGGLSALWHQQRPA